MSVNSLPSNYANAVTPYVSIGRQPVGQESGDLRTSSFKPTEQLAESFRDQNQRLPGDSPNLDGEQDRTGRTSSRQTAEQEQSQRRKTAQSEREQAELKQIETLAARDREVRAHEQAHAAVAGQYGGSPTYEFVRGPDGVSYAVGGSVNVDTSPIPGNPEATLRKAEQLQRAASAPADPSGQDREVAAQAAQLARQAERELAIKNADKAAEDKKSLEKSEADKRAEQKNQEEQRLAGEEARSAREQSGFEAEQRRLDERRARASEFDQISKRNINLTRRLIEIGVYPGATPAGALVNQTI